MRVVQNYRSVFLLLMVALLSWSGSAANAQTTFHDELLDHMVGHWTAQGVIGGMKETHDVEASWVLGHQYLCIQDTSRGLKADGTPKYESTVYISWQKKEAQYASIWLDIAGGISADSIGIAKRGGNEIPFVFHYEKSKLTSTFIYDPKSDTWQWNFDIQQNGKMVPFSQLTLTREK